MKNSLPSIFRRMYSVFSPPQKRRFTLLLLLLLTQGIVEVIGLALILPLLYVAQYPEKIAENKYLNFLYQFLNFDSAGSFTVFLAVVLVLAFVFKGLYSIIVIKIQTNTTFDFSKSFINDQIKVGFGMDYLTFKSRNSNIMVQDMISIPTEFATSVMQPFLLLLSELIVTMFIAIAVGIYNFKVFLGLVLVLLPPVIIFYRITRKRIVSLGTERNNLRAESYKHVFGAVHGIESVKITHAENYFRKKILGSFNLLFSKMSRLVVLENIPIRMIELTAIFAVSLLVIYSVLFTNASTSILPLLVVFATAAYRLLPSMNRIVSNSVRLRASLYVFDRFDEFSIYKQPDIESFNDSIDLHFNKSISMEDLTFNYPGNSAMVLKDINITLLKGEFLGVIGKSGQGKSTFLKVFLKLIEPVHGVIKCDSLESSISHIIDHGKRRSVMFNKRCFCWMDPLPKMSHLAKQILTSIGS